jgi:hypothetical protein
MSFREYARRSGVSLQAIQDRIKNGSISERAVVRTEGKRPKIDSDIADADFQRRHDPDQKAKGDIVAAMTSAKSPETPAKPIENKDDNPENLPDKAPKIVKKPEIQGAKAAQKVPDKGILPDTKPPEIPKPRVEEREINGQKVDATILPTLPEDKFDRYRDAKTSTEELRARKLELEVAEAEGRLLDAEDVRAKIVKEVSQVRESLLNIAPKVAPLLVSITNVVEMENKLIDEINSALEGLSRLDRV